MARKTDKLQELDFETISTQLEQQIAQLESGDLPLEQALSIFENGIALAKQGEQRLQQAKQRIQILLDKSETAELTDYQGD